MKGRKAGRRPWFGAPRALAVVLLAVPGALLAAASAAPAPAPSGVAAQLDTSADEARLLKAVEESLARKRGLDDKIAELDSQLRTTQDELRNATNRLWSLSVRERRAEIELADLREQMAATQHALQAQAIAAYTGLASRRAAVLLRAPDIGRVATEQAYRRVVAATQADLIVQRERLRDQTQDVVAELGEAREQAREERFVVAERQARLLEERDTQARLRYEIGVEIVRHDGLLREVISRRDEFEAVARELEAQSAAVAEQLQLRSSSRSSSGSAASASSSSSSPSGFARPLAATRVSSAFGYRVHPIYGDRRLHTGVDLSATTGTPIRAAEGGVVVSAGWLGGYGNAVVIDHGGGLATLYAHQSSMAVRTGAYVDKGDVIGRVGCTGACTGPHLHYEVRIAGRPVDPSPYL